MKQSSGSSGTAFDHMEVFSFNDAARVLAWTCKHKETISATNEIRRWIGILTHAYQEGELSVSIYDKDKTKTPHIQRGHLVEWCKKKSIHPDALFPSEANTQKDEAKAARVLGAVLDWLSKDKSIKQSEIVGAIESRNGKPGLGKTVINTTFAAANSAFKNAGN